MADSSKTMRDHVQLLTNDSFMGFARAASSALIIFAHPLSPRWIRFKPIFEQISGDLKDSTVKFGIVDYAESSALFKQYSISLTVPQLLYFKGFKSHKRYHGALDEKSITAYLKRQSFPILTTISTLSELEDFKKQNDVTVVGYFQPGNGALEMAFADLAESLRDDYLFGMAEGDAFEDKRIRAASMVVYKHYDDPELVCDITRDISTNKIALKVACRRLVAEFRPELQDQFCSIGFPLAYIFVDSEQDKIRLCQEIHELAKTHKGTLQFGTADVNLFEDFTKNLHLPKHWPAFAIWEPEKNRKFPLNLNEENLPLETAVEAFVEDFVAGKLEPKVQSAPIPIQSSPVLEVVADTWEEIVLNNQKDVLVEFYTKWCGPCKTLLPEYERLVRMYADDEVLRERDKIAKIDVEGNDVPVRDIRGVPMFVLFRAGEKGERVVCGGSKYGVEEWRGFIGKEGTWGGKVGGGFE